MEFIKTEGTAELEATLVASLNNALSENKKVLWLVPGGSNIAVASKVMSRLNDNNLSKLTIMLTDERFGLAGHADSNYEQLKSVGFDYKSASFKDILTSQDVKVVKRFYSDEAEKNFNSVDFVIAFFGMGPDGHIAGILPHSPATNARNIWAESYESEPYVRITLTPFALSHVKQAYVGAFGDSKLEAITNLRDKKLPISEQPAQILCHIPEVKIFNDQIGDMK